MLIELNFGCLIPFQTNIGKLSIGYAKQIQIIKPKSVYMLLYKSSQLTVYKENINLTLIIENLFSFIIRSIYEYFYELLTIIMHTSINFILIFNRNNFITAMI